MFEGAATVLKKLVLKIRRAHFGWGAVAIVVVVIVVTVIEVLPQDFFTDKYWGRAPAG